MVTESTCPVYMGSVLLAVHTKYVLHPTTTPRCYHLLLCPSCQCLLLISLQELPNSAHFLLTCTPTPSRSPCDHITTWLETTECLLIALRKKSKSLITFARTCMIWPTLLTPWASNLPFVWCLLVSCAFQPSLVNSFLLWGLCTVRPFCSVWDTRVLHEACTLIADSILSLISLKCQHLREDFPDHTIKSNSLTPVTLPYHSVLFSS